MRRLVVLGLTLLLLGCGGGSSDSTGPSASDIIIESETLVPSPISSRFCVVRTSLFNTSRRTYNVTLRWRAFNGAGEQFAEALDFIGGAAPNARTVSLSASFGTTVPCSAIARFERYESTARAL